MGNEVRGGAGVELKSHGPSSTLGPSVGVSERLGLNGLDYPIPVEANRLPYMLGGLTLLQSDRSELQVQVGVGAQFPLYHRLQMAVDLRGNGGGSTMIVRPTAALIYNFR